MQHKRAGLRPRAFLVLLAALLLCACTSTGAIEGDAAPLVVHFIDVGQGDSTLLQGPDFTLLIDAGRHDRDDVVPFLTAAGVRSIDLLVGTHPHADHIGQIDRVLAAFPVREVWFSGELTTTATFERAIDAVLASDAGYHEPRAGERFTFGSADVQVLHPAALSGDLNDGSISLRIVYGDVAFLFTGDAEARGEAAMAARGHVLDSDVLHVGHHGSRTSSTEAFLQAVTPEFAVYSSGSDNPYGHPHPETLARFDRLDIPVYGTDVHGTIVIRTDGAALHIETEREAAADRWHRFGPPTGHRGAGTSVCVVGVLAPPPGLLECSFRRAYIPPFSVDFSGNRDTIEAWQAFGWS